MAFFQPIMLAIEEELECEICGECFDQRDALLDHRQIHYFTTQRTCSDCGKVMERNDFKKHSYTFCIDTKRYVCKYCGTQFESPSLLEHHSALHASIKPYECWDCRELFICRDYFIKHRRTRHWEIRPVTRKRCPECRIEFVTSSEHFKLCKSKNKFKTSSGHFGDCKSQSFSGNEFEFFAGLSEPILIGTSIYC